MSKIEYPMETYKIVDGYIVKELTDRDLAREGYGAVVWTDDERYFVCKWSNRYEAWKVESEGKHGCELVKKVASLGDFLREYGKKITPLFLDGKEWADGELAYFGKEHKSTMFCYVYARVDKE